MCPAGRVVPYSGPACKMCLSRGHSTETHSVLERAVARYEPWAIGSLGQICFGGMNGAPSPSEKIPAAQGTPILRNVQEAASALGVDLALPDRVRIVRCIIGTDGWDAESLPGAAILRQWSEDASGGCTFMLSCNRLMKGEVESLAKLCGDLGSALTVELRLKRSTLN